MLALAVLVEQSQIQRARLVVIVNSLQQLLPSAVVMEQVQTPMAETEALAAAGVVAALLVQAVRRHQVKDIGVETTRQVLVPHTPVLEAVALALKAATLLVEMVLLAGMEQTHIQLGQQQPRLAPAGITLAEAEVVALMLLMGAQEVLEVVEQAGTEQLAPVLRLQPTLAAAGVVDHQAELFLVTVALEL